MTSQSKAAKAPAYLSGVNPRGTIPAIDDNGVILWESHAILVYLCETHGWTDLWPTDVVHRALVTQYLHFHHRNTREIVIQWSRALWPAVFGVTNPDKAWIKRNTFPGLENNVQIVDQALQIIDGMLATTPYIAGDSPTLADIAAYEELGQNQAKYANCTDFAPYTNIVRWLAAMENLPAHEPTHAIWSLIGPIDQFSGGMQAIAQANKEAARLIQQAAT